MRRRINLAGLLQYLLMVLLACLLVLLVSAGASPGAFALALAAGALLAALPAVYIAVILLPGQTRAMHQVRRDGLLACAEVLADGEQLAADFTRHAGAYKSLPLTIEIPVRVQPASAGLPYQAQLSDPAPRLAQLKPGMWLSVRCNPADPSRVVPAESPEESLTTWTVRPVREEDYLRLAALIRTAFEEQRSLLDPPAGALGETAESLQTRMQSSSGLLAEAGGAPVACVFYRFETVIDLGTERRFAFLSRLAVLPEYRRMGIGRCLLAQAEGIALQEGCTRVRLGVRAEIPRNREYYQRLGYRVVEEKSHEGYTKITVYILEKLRP